MCGGSSAKTDRTTQLFGEGKERDIGQTLTDIGTKLTGKGMATTDKGVSDIEKASKYYTDILSGDPSKVLASVSPEITSVVGQTDEARKKIAEGGNRSGGSVSAALSLEDKARTGISDIIARARPAAAAGVESTGTKLAGIGTGETGQGLGATSNALQAFSSLAEQGMKSRELSQKIHDDAVQQWAEVASLILFGV